MGLLTRENCENIGLFFYFILLLLRQNVFGCLPGTAAAYTIVSLSTRGNRAFAVRERCETSREYFHQNKRTMWNHKEMFSNVSPRNVQSQLSHHGSISHGETGEENVLFRALL